MVIIKRKSSEQDLTHLKANSDEGMHIQTKNLDKEESHLLKHVHKNPLKKETEN